MADESVDFQTTVVATPPANTKVAVDTIAGVSYQRVKLDGGGDGALVPIVAGRQADAASLPAALSTEDVAILGALTETAPATDTASSGLNGRLQRIAQRLTTLIALVPAALTGSGNFKVSLQESNASQAVTVPTDPFGANADAASASGSLSAKLRQLATVHPSALGQAAKSGSLAVVLPSDQVLTPKWTDGTTITAIKTLARGTSDRATYAVTSKYGAYIYIYLARTGTTAITTLGLQVRIRRIVNGVANLVPEAAFSADINAAVSAAAAASGNGVGTTTFTLNASATFASGTNGEIWLAILDSTSSPTTASEWVRMSKATDANNTSKLFDAPTINAHNNTGHTVIDKANVFRAFVPGGGTYEIIVDYGAAGAGESYVYQILAQSLDSEGWA